MKMQRVIGMVAVLLTCGCALGCAKRAATGSQAFAKAAPES